MDFFKANKKLRDFKKKLKEFKKYSRTDIDLSESIAYELLDNINDMCKEFPNELNNFEKLKDSLNLFLSNIKERKEFNNKWGN